MFLPFAPHAIFIPLAAMTWASITSENSPGFYNLQWNCFQPYKTYGCLSSERWSSAPRMLWRWAANGRVLFAEGLRQAVFIVAGLFRCSRPLSAHSEEDSVSWCIPLSYSLQLQYCFLWAFSPFRRHLAELCSVMPRVCAIIKKEKELEISTSLTGQSFTLITAWIN